MRIVLVLLLLAGSGSAQNPGVAASDCQTCGYSSAALLYRPVIRAMWSQDEIEHHSGDASGFIRIAVHPTSSPEFFVDVRLNRKGAATVILYSLPKGTSTVTTLIEKELKQNPCVDPKSLAETLRVLKRPLEADKKMQDLITEFFVLRWEPRRIPTDAVRLDATEYELEYMGDDTLVFASDDHETPVVRWIESFLSAVHAAASR